MKKAHVIGRKTFDLGFYSRAQASEMQSAVSRLAHGQLSRILESFLDRYSLEGKSIHIDSLQLDVGDIPYNELESELPIRFEKELERLLPAFIRKSKDAPGEENFTRTNEESLLETFRYFLNNGTVPWWVSQASAGFIAQALNTLASQQSSDLARLIRQEGRKANVLRRIVLQFTDTQLEIIVRVLEPRDAAFIIAYSHELDRSVKAKPIKEIHSGEKFRNIKWELIIGYLISDRGSDFNRKAFLRHTISGIAARYNISYLELLNQLVRVTKELVVPVGAASSLPALLRSLERESDAESEEAQSQQTEKQKGVSGKEETENDLRLFRYVLMHGSMPHWAAQTGRTEFRLLIQKLLVKEPVASLELLSQLSSYPEVVPRYVSHTSEPQLQLTVKIAEPAQATNIQSFVKTMNKVSRTQETVFAPEKEFSKSIWSFVLSFLLENRGTGFSSRALVRNTLQQIASRYAIAYDDVLVILLDTIEDKKSGISWSPALASVVRELGAESDIEIDPVKGSKKTAKKKTKKAGKKSGAIAASSIQKPDEAETEPIPETETQLLADLFYVFLSTGKIPWWAKDRFGTSDIKNVFEELLRTNETVLNKLIRKISKDEEMFERLIRRLDKEQVGQVVKLVSKGGKTEPFSEWIMEMEKVLSQKSGKKSQTVSFIHQLRVRLLHRIPEGGESSFNFTGFIYEMIGEMKSRYSFPVSEILMLMADASAALPAAYRQKMLSILGTMHRDKAVMLYTEIAKEKKDSPEKESLEKWLNDPAAWLSQQGRAGMQAQAQTQIVSAAAEAWIEIVLNHERPQLSGNADLTWNDILEAVQFLYPDSYQNYLPKLRKQFAAFLKIRAIPSDALPGIEPVFRIFFSKGNANLSTREARVALESFLDRVLETHRLQSRDLFSQWLVSPHIRKRLIELLRNDTLAELLSVFSAHDSGLGSSLILDFFTLWEKINKDIPEMAEKKILQEASLFFASKMKRTSFSSIEWIQSLLRVTGKLTGIDTHVLASTWKQFATRYATEWRSDLLLLLDHLSDPVYLERMGDRFLARLKKMEDEVRRQEEEAKRRKEKQKKPEDTRERILVQNAGLILVAPFVNRLFTRLELALENKFVSEEAKQRGVAVLQYLAVPDGELDEIELTLNKLLCGIELSEPIDKTVRCTESEKNVCEGMLASVISNWKILGGTSVNTFRETFLQRQGGLLFAEEKWEMRVERKAYDKLMMQLPWSINMIRLPWMAYPIFTEWKT